MKRRKKVVNEPVVKFNKVQDEINKELIKEEKDKTRKKDINPSYVFLKAFVARLKEDKLYLLSFIITLVFFSFFSFVRLKETEGYYDKKEEEQSTPQVTPTVDPNFHDKDDKDEMDVSSYVGIYSKEAKLDEPVKINDEVTLSSYKIVYELKKDKTLTKYYLSPEFGTIKCWKDDLKYVSDGGARFISAHGINYLFSANNMKEVDGDAYQKDNTIKNLKHDYKLKDVSYYFVKGGLVLTTYDDLFLIKNNGLGFKLSDKLLNNGGEIENHVYKVNDKDEFKVILFNNGENKNCYSKEEIGSTDFKDGINYKIYLLKYDNTIGNFSEPKELISRNKSDSCKLYEEDINSINK